MIETIIVEMPDQAGALASTLQSEEDFKVTVASSFEEAERLAAKLNCVVVLVGPGVDLNDAEAFAERSVKTHLPVAVVLISKKFDAELLRRALRAGIRDVIADEPGEISSAVRRAYELTCPPEAVSGDDGLGQRRRAPVITFFSTKGGVGKTVFATNTAVGLAKEHCKQVILLDFDCQFGDVGVMLGLRPERTIGDLMPAIDRLDTDMLSGCLTDHSSGARVLLAPPRPDASKQIRGAELQKICDIARDLADFIVIDTPSSFGDATLPILDDSDCVFLVTTLDVPSVKNSHIALQTMKLLNYPQEKIKLLLNRADSKVSLSPAEVERHLDCEISVQIPSDRGVPRSVNEGSPLILENHRSPISNALREVAAAAAVVSLQEPTSPEENKVGSK